MKNAFTNYMILSNKNPAPTHKNIQKHKKKLNSVDPKNTNVHSAKEAVFRFMERIFDDANVDIQNDLTVEHDGTSSRAKDTTAPSPNGQNVNAPSSNSPTLARNINGKKDEDIQIGLATVPCYRNRPKSWHGCSDTWSRMPPTERTSLKASWMESPFLGVLGKRFSAFRPFEKRWPRNIKEKSISAALSGLENMADFQKRQTPRRMKAKKNLTFLCPFCGAK